MEGRKNPEQSTEEGRQPQYHVYVRLPFNRGDFVDPGPVNWDERKSEALWSILSDSSLADVDWTRLATEFDVSVEFLLQMANYLTERHTSQLRAQMLRAAAARGSSAPSPVPGAEPAAHQPTFEPMRRISSGTGRAPSALSIRKEAGTPIPKNEGERDTGSPARPSTKSRIPIRPRTDSRTSSTSTAVPTRSQPDTRPGTAVRQTDPQLRRLSYAPTPTGQNQYQRQPQQQEEPEQDTEIPPPSPAASTSSSSSSSSDSPVQSRIIRRPPRFQPKDNRGAGGGGGGVYDDSNDDDADDDDDEPAFLPSQQQTGSAQGMTGGSSSGADLGATLRGDMRGGGFATAGRRDGGGASIIQSQTSDSSAGSAAIVPRRPRTAGAGAGERRLPGGGNQGPLSPRRTAELVGRGSGLGKGKGVSREGSEGTPSMGSSFSDLDDASVTQSALEEALASRMQDGTIGSRMSVIGGTIGQAIRSRYLPQPQPKSER